MADFLPYDMPLFLPCLFSALLFPLVSFLVSVSISEKYSWIISFTAPLLHFLSTLAAALVFYSVWNNDPFTISLNWFTINEIPFTVGILLNDISALMLLVVTFVSFLVNFYSTGYMAGDPGIKRYFGMLGFFTFSMLGVILADNLLLIFIFWELVGFSSYMLIGHWNENPAATEAAKRAFLFNRVGDLGFLVGLMIIWGHASTFDIQLLSAQPETFSWQMAASLCFFCGVIGKSAQFPLFLWLPDAMEGPTPVSALIHAATMVAAGVFLLARIHFLFPPTALDVVAVIGCLTALLAALAAVVQTDIKRILAYSTISQLGFMVLAAGAGAPEAAMLHLVTHAFFKACLFLAAGSVIHALHLGQAQSHSHFNVQDIRNLGGLRKKLPFTFVMFVIAGSALGGLPLFSGFLSKDAILTAVVSWTGSTVSWRWLIVGSAFAVSFLTVLYTFRMIWTVFFGEERLTQSLEIIEPPLAMRVPTALLAAASCWIFVSWNPFDFNGWIYATLQTKSSLHSPLMSIVSAGWVLLALGVAMLTRERTIQSRLFLHGFYMADFYKVIITDRVMQLASIAAYLDKKWVDGLLHATAYFHLIAAHFIRWFDHAMVDGVVDGVASVAQGMGSFTRSFQRGKVQLYIFWALFATIIFIIWMLL